MLSSPGSARWSHACERLSCESLTGTDCDGGGLFGAVRVEEPRAFYGTLAAAIQLTALGLSIPLFVTYFETGLVPRFPTAILVTGMTVVAILTFFAGLTLSAIKRARTETRRLAYLAQPAPGETPAD